jgi:regulator of protease activity HflC (stomatin/prohibitin superfamily)
MERGLVERFGKYQRFVDPGITFLVPIADRLMKVNITERMTEVQPQVVITKDKVNMNVDAVIFFRVKPDEPSVKASQYNVQNFVAQIEMMARTTLRAVIGNMEMAEANISRQRINDELKLQLTHLSKNWGIDVLSAELKDLLPPRDLQESMNQVLKADNQRLAAINLATAVETEADGRRRASIKLAEGDRQAVILRAEAVRESKILEAQGIAEATKLTNVALTTYFKDSAVVFKQLETVATSLQNNSKLIVPQGTALSLILSESEGLGSQVVPIRSESPTPPREGKSK